MTKTPSAKERILPEFDGAGKIKAALVWQLGGKQLQCFKCKELEYLATPLNRI